MLESILLNKGYIKFDPKHDSITVIYADCFNKIFHKDYIFEKTGVRRLRIDYNGIRYQLHYVLERKELPNILAVVYLENDGKVWGFYKENISLDGIILLPEITGLEENVWAFF